MTNSKDPTGKAHSDEPGYTSYAGSTWAPKGIGGGLTGVSLFCFVVGIVTLVLALADVRPVITWLFAVIGLISGLRVFMPRVTTLDKVLISIGALTSLIAIIVLLAGLSS